MVINRFHFGLFRHFVTNINVFLMPGIKNPRLFDADILTQNTSQTHSIYYVGTRHVVSNNFAGLPARLLDFRPIIAQCHRAVENQGFRRRIGVNAEITQAFKLVARSSFCIL
jgi:hypothetical protein